MGKLYVKMTATRIRVWRPMQDPQDFIGKMSVKSNRNLLQRKEHVSSVDGCQEWGSLFPETVRNSQSPINLVSRDACYDPDLEKKGLRFNYFTSRETDILNNGHTLAVFPRAKQESLRHDSVGRSGLAGGPLPDETEYELAEIRFHWGRENNKGSEHTVNDKAFPMEVQLVHWNSQLYPCIEDAAGNPFGIAIVSLFAQIGREHSGLKIVTDNLEDVLYKGRQKTITSGFNPSCLLPDPSLRDFWVYDGSLTTPPCYEKVTWIIMRYPLMLSHSQIEEFRRLRTFSKGEYPRAGEDGILVDNFRSIQKLAGRCVKASFQY